MGLIEKKSVRVETEWGSKKLFMENNPGMSEIKLISDVGILIACDVYLGTSS